MPCCCFVPPHILEVLARRDDVARETVTWDARTRHLRAVQVIASPGALPGPPPGGVRRAGQRRVVERSSQIHVYDAAGKLELGATPADPSLDPIARQARTFVAFTQKFLLETLGRRGIDGKNAGIDVHVHFGRNFLNAFWTGHELVLGDGDERLFRSMASSIDVVAHEIGHGVVQHTAGLEYRGESASISRRMFSRC